jgi:hypothetical protein
MCVRDFTDSDKTANERQCKQNEKRFEALLSVVCLFCRTLDSGEEFCVTVALVEKCARGATVQLTSALEKGGKVHRVWH